MIDMKNVIKLLLSAFLFTSCLIACKKDENKVYFEGGTNPVLSSSVTGPDLPLTYVNRDKEAVKFTWTNPDYKFNTGISSQDVNYQIEIDTVGANFTNPNKQTISVSKDLSRSIGVSEINGYLLNQLQLQNGHAHEIEIRVKSFLGSDAQVLYSNVLKYTITPYSIPPAVEPPTNGTLWLTGSATESDYKNPLPAPLDVTHKFAQISTTLYELTIDMKGGGAYKLIQEQGVWSSQYHMKTGGTWNSGDFEKKDAEPGFAGPPAAGRYKITVDFQRGKYSAVKL
jgi:starch-binding outer membrane protein SusE/F